jgi:hypothetical protein
MIRPGESVLWRCKSTGVAKGIEGSVTFHMSGHPPHDKVRFTWKNRYFGPNAYYAQTTRDGYKIEVEGGEGARAVVVFVLGKWSFTAPPPLARICLLPLKLSANRRTQYSA